MTKKAIVLLLALALFMNLSEITKAETFNFAIPPIYEDGISFQDGLAVVQQNKKWGYIDKVGNVVVPFKYEAADPFSGGLAVVRKKQGDKWKNAYINIKGEEVTPFKYDTAGQLQNGYATPSIGRSDENGGQIKLGLVGQQGEILPPIYDEIRLASYAIGLDQTNGLLDSDIFIAMKDGKQAFINTKGKQITDFIYDDADSFSNGLARVRKGKKEGFIDLSGKVVIPLEYDFVRWFSEGLAMVYKNQKYGFIDTSGKVIVPFIYDQAWFFIDGLAQVSKGEKYGFVDYTGQEVVPIKYDSASNGFEDGLALVSSGKDYVQYGYVNKKGKEVVPLIYDYAEEFKGGYAKVSKGGYGSGANYQGGKFTYIDITGKELIPRIYDFVGGDVWTGFKGIQGGVSPVSNGGTGNLGNYADGKWGYVNIDGKEFVPLIYDKTWSFREGIGRVLKNGKYGFVDVSGKEITPCIYDDANDFTNGVTEVQIGSKVGFIDSDGNVVAPIIYDMTRGTREGMGIVRVDDYHVGFLGISLPFVSPVTMTANEADQTISLSSQTSGAIIYYTTNGSKPDPSMVDGTRVYTKPISARESVTIKAVADNKGMQVSPSTTFVYKHTPIPITDSVKPKPNTKTDATQTPNTKSSGFIDVDEHHWAFETIKWAIAKNIVSGYSDGSFKPEGDVTEPEFLAMLVRANPDIALPESNLAKPWYEAYFDLADQYHWPVLHEVDGKNFNRGQVARLLAGSQGFLFSLNDAVQYVIDLKMAKGKTSSTVNGFGVQDKLKRSEALTLIKNMKEASLKLVKTEKKAAWEAGSQFRVRGISIGDTEKAVLEQLGEPARKDLSEYGFLWYIYNQDYANYAQVGIQNGKVVGLYSNVGNWTSKRDIHLDSTISEVSSAYGRISQFAGEFDAAPKYLTEGSYATIFLDNYNDNKVTAIQLIEQSVESYKKEGNPSLTDEVRVGFERQVFDLTNSTRVRFGLKPFIWDDVAADTARKHSLDMIDKNFFAHVNLEGKDPFDRMKDAGISLSSGAENIAGGQQNAIFALAAWMNSKTGHRDNILRDVERLGVGVGFGGNYKTYYTQNFYTPLN